MVPTRGNLIIATNTLKLSRTGYELLDRKRVILIQEIMQLMESAKQIEDKIKYTYEKAYSALKIANLELGIEYVEKLSLSVEIEDSIKVKSRSVMGVEIPIVIMNERENKPSYGFCDSTSSLDEAMACFNKVKNLTKTLAQIETAAFRLADSIKKTQKRANALKNIVIPKYENEIKNIINALEEKDREEFSRLKVIKIQKT